MRLATLTGPVRLQELVCAADSEVEAVLAYRNALENALGQPAAAHPVEGYGASSLSLAQVAPLANDLLSRFSGALTQEPWLADMCAQPLGRHACAATWKACMPGWLVTAPVTVRSLDHS